MKQETSCSASAQPQISADHVKLCSSGTLRGVLFDIDGTLCDSDPLHLKAFQVILAREGVCDGEKIDYDFFKRNISGRSNVEIFSELFPERGAAEQLALADEKEALYRDLAVGDLQAMKGLASLTEWLKQRGVRCAAVTNAPRQNAELMLKGVGLDGYFEHVVIGSECAAAKPSPEPYIQGMKLLGVDATEAFAVEDSKPGMQAAIAAQLPLVGVTTTQSARELIEGGAILAVADFEDSLLWNALSTLNTD
ncbi:hypothetical protein CYMTET_22842 [Cymbomonas tetramitiformis]|uniref:Uncharacterized protein n=1 Tax=Cymbomonas tetramitiformis TaxID=36881 RepID=A0AAE0FZY1_9CHLO|nr:hypothetical protein CYMTET_22842 [Cymbomonas tetramitiformis]